MVVAAAVLVSLECLLCNFTQRFGGSQACLGVVQTEFY